MKPLIKLSICVLSITVLSTPVFSQDNGTIRKGSHEVELSVSTFTGIKSRLNGEIDYWNTMYDQYVNSSFADPLSEYAIPVRNITSVPYIGAGYRYRILNWLALGADFHYGFGSYALKWDKSGDKAWDVNFHDIRILFSSRFYWFSSSLVELYSELSLGASIKHCNSPFNGLSFMTYPTLESLTPAFSQEKWETDATLDFDIRILGITIGKEKGIYGKLDGGLSLYKSGYLRVGLGYRF